MRNIPSEFGIRRETWWYGVIRQEFVANSYRTCVLQVEFEFCFMFNPSKGHPIESIPTKRGPAPYHSVGVFNSFLLSFVIFL